MIFLTSPDTVAYPDGMSKPLILITNDDGIESPGLMAAAEAVKDLGDVLVVAPTRQQTSMGRSFWGAKTERLIPCSYSVDGKAVPAYHANCSPARIVLHAMDILCTKRKPDLLVSGINYGENLGSNITISGTIGAAIQGATMGVPGLAVSLETDIAHHHKHVDLDWTAARHFAREFADRILRRSISSKGDIWNINVPRSATPATKFRITRQSRQPYFVNLIAEPSLDRAIGDAECVLGYDTATLDKDTDIYAIAVDRVVSATPLSFDLTAS
jgi:5'-nucleotidase